MKRLVAIACLILLLGASLSLVLRPAPAAPVAPVIVLPLPYSIPPEKLSLFERWVPQWASWAWLWRLKETITGRRKSCDMRATVVDFAGTGEAFLTNHPLPTPAFTGTNGLRIWLLSEAEARALGRDLRQKPGPEISYMAGIITGDGGQARLTAGSTFPIMGRSVNVGLAIDLLPHLRPTVTDITTIISLTEAITNQASTTAGPPPASIQNIQTNFEVAARLQIPKGSGVFLLQGEPAAAHQKRIGVLLAVTASPSKK